MARQFLAGLRAEAPGALSLRTQRAPIAEFTRQDAPVAKSFPSDFYVTCATAIPVLFLVFAVRGNTYGEMLTVARKAAVTLPRTKAGLLHRHGPFVGGEFLAGRPRQNPGRAGGATA
jgi:hypothetical protein